MGTVDVGVLWVESFCRFYSLQCHATIAVLAEHFWLTKRARATVTFIAVWSNRMVGESASAVSLAVFAQVCQQRLSKFRVHFQFVLVCPFPFGRVNSICRMAATDAQTEFGTRGVLLSFLNCSCFWRAVIVVLTNYSSRPQNAEKSGGRSFRRLMRLEFGVGSCDF